MVLSIEYAPDYKLHHLLIRMNDNANTVYGQSMPYVAQEIA
jgi:hypothetical protein